MTRKRDLASSVASLIVAAVFCAGAVHYGLTRRGVPGPGFLPFFAGLGLVLLALIQLISRLWDGDREERKDQPLSFFPERGSWKRLAMVMGSLVFYVLALEYLGFLVTTFLFVSVLLAIEPKGWAGVVGTSILATGGSYLIFQLLLKVQLPRGVFRLWGGF
jgi:putative tricarboxylic transport membrane protein